jgi:hypothetical protein
MYIVPIEDYSCVELAGWSDAGNDPAHIVAGTRERSAEAYISDGIRPSSPRIYRRHNHDALASAIMSVA